MLISHDKKKNILNFTVSNMLAVGLVGALWMVMGHGFDLASHVEHEKSGTCPKATITGDPLHNLTE